MMFLDVHSKFGSPGFFDVSNRTSENENIEFMKSLKMGAVLGQLFKPLVPNVMVEQLLHMVLNDLHVL